MRNLGVLPSMSMANLFSPLFGADTIDSCWGGEMAGMAKVDGESKMAEAREAVVIAACWGTIGTTELMRDADFPLAISTISWKSFVLKQETTFSKKTGGLKKSNAGQGKNQCLKVYYNVYTFDPLYLAGLLLRRRFFQCSYSSQMPQWKDKIFLYNHDHFQN